MPKPQSDIELLVKQFADEAQAEHRYDDETKRPYRAYQAIPANPAQKNLFVYVDTVETNRPQMHISGVIRREQIVRDGYNLELDLDLWNRVHADEEPIVLPMDFIMDNAIRKASCPSPDVCIDERSLRRAGNAARADRGAEIARNGRCCAMMPSLHKNATTTPTIRGQIAGSEEPAAVLAVRYGVTLDTIYRWRGRTSFEDRSHTAHQLATTLTPAQEAVVVELRRMLLLPLDDLLAVAREFLDPDVSRSDLDRCLRRHRVSNLNALRPKTPAEPHKTFEAYEPGFLHVDVKYLPQMADETTRRYLFVAIDRATRWVFVRILPARTAANARRVLRDLPKVCPIRIAGILTDNGKEFADRLFASRARAPSGTREFDQLCTDHSPLSLGPMARHGSSSSTA